VRASAPMVFTSDVPAGVPSVFHNPLPTPGLMA
jgi:hypothetical protein